MKTIQFKGHHSRVPHADTTLLPDRDHTLWQAWLLPSGRYIVQALNADKRPEGTIHLMDAKDFTQTLTPLLASMNPYSQATAPNIICEWYNEVASLKGQELYGPPIVEYGHSALPPLHPETTAAIEHARALAEEEHTRLAALAPTARHIEEQPHILPSSFSTQKTALANSQGYSGQEQTGQPIPRPLATPETHTPQCGCEPSSLRAQEIFQLIHDGDEQSLTEQVHYLVNVSLEESDSSHQAVLTEVGLALRQRKLYSLARLCHLRALEITPNDERILFNLARTEYEAGDIKAARDYLTRCLALAPDFNVAKNFLTFIGAGSS